MATQQEQPSTLMAGLQAQHDFVKMHYDRLAEQERVAMRVKEELDDLAQLGDSVTADDVVGASAGLIDAGLAPMDLAKQLSDMPPGGQALANWIGNHQQVVGKNLAAIIPAKETLRHDLGVSALRLLAGKNYEAGQGASASGPDVPSSMAGDQSESSAGSGNPLMGGA